MNSSAAAPLLEQANALLDQGALTQARVLFARVVDLDAGSAEAWLMLGAIDAQTGRVGEALQHVRQAVALDPEYEEAHLTLAGLQQQRGGLEEALQSCARALAIDADYEEAWLMQSGIQGALGLYADSEESSRQAIRLWPECVDAHVNLGNAQKEQGRWEAAVDAYRRALQLNPGLTEVIVNLGHVLLELDQLENAENCFRRVLMMDSANVDACLGMARMYLARNDPESALEPCRQAITARHGSVPAHLALCECLVLAGRLDAAAAACAAIPAGSGDDDVRVSVTQARILERQGDYPAAFERMEEVLQHHPDAPEAVLAFADISRYLQRSGVAGAQLERQLRRDHPVGIRRQLHFSLGRLYDADGRYEEAFRQFRQANDLKPAAFDQAAHAAAIDSLIEAYSPDFLASRPATGNDSQRPVFIVGLPRAGTTLVEQILSSHSAVFGAGELPYIGRMAVTLATRFGCTVPYPDCIRTLPQDAYTTLAREYLARLTEKSASAVRITDKQNGNYLHLGLIQLLFPQARVIHCARAPLDTCLSLYTHDMGGEATYTRSFEDLACYYRHYDRLMRHWRGVLQLPLLDIAYEDLVRDQEGKTRELLRFCGLEWEPRCLDFHKNRRAVTTPSHAQVRQPMYTSSLGRWRHYDRQLTPLRQLLGG